MSIQRKPVDAPPDGQDERDDEEPTIQTKLTIGAVDDEYERQADQVAAAVQSLSSNKLNNRDTARSHGTTSGASSIQRSADRSIGNGGSATSKGKNPLNRDKGGADSVPSNVRRTIESPGSGTALNESVRTQVEPILGSDLSNVRVHSGASVHRRRKYAGRCIHPDGSFHCRRTRHTC